MVLMRVGDNYRKERVIFLPKTLNLRQQILHVTGFSRIQGKTNIQNDPLPFFLKFNTGPANFLSSSMNPNLHFF